MDPQWTKIRAQVHTGSMFSLQSNKECLTFAWLLLKESFTVKKNKVPDLVSAQILACYEGLGLKIQV